MPLLPLARRGGIAVMVPGPAGIVLGLVMLKVAANDAPVVEALVEVVPLLAIAAAVTAAGFGLFAWATAAEQLRIVGAAFATEMVVDHDLILDDEWSHADEITDLEVVER